METGVSVENVHAFVLGGHGDTMVPLPRYSTVAGIPLPDYRACRRSGSTRSASAPPTAAPRSPSWSAPAPGTRRAPRRPRWSRAILKDKKKIVPCSVFLQGEYGINDLFVGVPVKLGARGVEQIIEIKLTPEEDAALKKSAARRQGTRRT